MTFHTGGGVKQQLWTPPKRERERERDKRRERADDLLLSAPLLLHN